MDSHYCDVTGECVEVSPVELKISDLAGFLNDLEADHEVYRILRNIADDEFPFGESRFPVALPQTECHDVIEIPRGYYTASVTADEMSNTARPSCTAEELCRLVVMISNISPSKEQRVEECEKAIRLLLNFGTQSLRTRSLTPVRFDTDTPKSLRITVSPIMGEDKYKRSDTV
ncbi:hypothetical protein KIN20_018750 [Parelaphostrongylus tenuis]|uniref:Uncharacterized protein n=1 Tax=Parelaphostrongylus tenuis TaxID=148309 RepID=A0AAD5QRT8_PARTN|nr:hypothetical protein KIN20_018750 [Parelaphostrongylus tenuis]